ncbi:MAG: hypothetical protein L0226_15350 [Acidobacteria bacterium]|nr:hypothetical protein [Acidobacteriota bacterium]
MDSLHEKGGKFHEVPVHHTAEEYLDAYIEAAEISEQKINRYSERRAERLELSQRME